MNAFWEGIFYVELQVLLSTRAPLYIPPSPSKRKKGKHLKSPQSVYLQDLTFTPVIVLIFCDE
jgi:hypothetical protein